MEYNPELERAEAELQERFRRERKERKHQPHATWSDHVISFSAVIHFVASLIWIGLFLIAPVFLYHNRNSAALIGAWVCSLPAGVASMGIALALVRVLDLTTGPATANQTKPQERT